MLNHVAPVSSPALRVTHKPLVFLDVKGGAHYLIRSLAQPNTLLHRTNVCLQTTMIKAPPERRRQLPLDDSDLSEKWLNLAAFQLSAEQTVRKGHSERNRTSFN